MADQTPPLPDAEQPLSSQSIALIREMLKEGFICFLKINPYPGEPNGVESGWAMFCKPEWEQCLDVLEMHDKECDWTLREVLEAYSGSIGDNDPNAWLVEAADTARNQEQRWRSWGQTGPRYV